MCLQINGGRMTLDKSIRILDKILEYSLYGLAFFIPVSIALTETCTITAIVTFLLKKILSLKLKPRPERDSTFFSYTNIALLLFFVSCALSLFNCEPYLSKGLNALLGKWGKFIMLFWVAGASLGTGNRLRNICLVFLASGSLVAIDSYIQKFFNLEFLLRRPMIPVHYAGRIEYAVTGAFKHSNNLAAYLICAIPLLAGVAVAVQQSAGAQKKIRQTLLNAFFLAVILLLTFCLVLTFSRGGWLGFGVAGSLMLFLLPRKKFVLLLGAAFLILIFSLHGVSERVVATVQSGGDSGRFELWDGAWAMIAEHPFLGKGVGTFMAFSKDYVPGREPVYAHNFVLQMWAEVGIFGLLSFLAFVGAVLRGGLLVFLQNKSGKTAPILAGLLCGAVAFLVQSTLDTNLYSLQPSTMFWLFLGMIGALSRPLSTPGLTVETRCR